MFQNIINTKMNFTWFAAAGFFYLFELFLFVLPVLPDSLGLRFGIVALYFVAHQMKVQTYYAETKSVLLDLLDHTV